MKKKPINQLKLTFPSRSVNEALARSIAAAFVSQLDPTLEELSDVKTAVSEAVTNVVVHAYPQGTGRIDMTLSLYEGGVLDISVRDKGCGIEDVAQALQPTYTTGGSDRSGMGFTIMESFMGSLWVRSSPGKGTSVRMRKIIGDAR